MHSRVPASDGPWLGGVPKGAAPHWTASGSRDQLDDAGWIEFLANAADRKGPVQLMAAGDLVGLGNRTAARRSAASRGTRV